jgi:hypothetical protein
VGTVIRGGVAVRSAGRVARRVYVTLLLLYGFGMFGVALLISSAPLWFKLVFGALGFQLFRFLNRRLAGRSARG